MAAAAAGRTGPGLADPLGRHSPPAAWSTACGQACASRRLSRPQRPAACSPGRARDMPAGGANRASAPRPAGACRRRQRFPRSAERISTIERDDFSAAARLLAFDHSPRKANPGAGRPRHSSAYCCSSSPSPAAPATTTPLARTAATRSGNWRWKTWPGAACRSRNTRPSVRQFSRKNRKPPSASPTPPYAVPPSEASKVEKARDAGFVFGAGRSAAGQALDHQRVVDIDVQPAGCSPWSPHRAGAAPGRLPLRRRGGPPRRWPRKPACRHRPVTALASQRPSAAGGPRRAGAAGSYAGAFGGRRRRCCCNRRAGPRERVHWKTASKAYRLL